MSGIYRAAVNALLFAGVCVLTGYVGWLLGSLLVRLDPVFR